MNPPQNWTEMWNQRFNCDTFVYGTQPNGFLQDHCGKLRIGNTLCLADGEGRNGVFLASKGHNVTSVDISSIGLSKAARLASERGVAIKTILADLEAFDLGIGRWDNIISIFCHLPIHIRRDLHRRVQFALRPGGIFLLEAYTHEQIELATGGPKTIDLLMTLPALQSELSGLIMEHAIELKRDIIEGELHNGTSAVVQIIAKRPSWEIY